jgi:hypothetical protein
MKAPRLCLIRAGLLTTGLALAAFHSGALPSAAGAESQSRYQVGIAGYRFDPLDMEQVVPEDLRLTAEAQDELDRSAAHYLVQLKSPLD